MTGRLPRRVFRPPHPDDVQLYHAVHALEQHEPQFSARETLTARQAAVLAACALFMFAAILISPKFASLVFTAAMAVGFAANAVFRASLVWIGADDDIWPSLGSTDPGALPVYTIIVPLYREANVLPQLLDALQALDYPPERLDIKLVLEGDDLETVRVAESLAHADNIERIVLRPCEPRTKPKACNVALQRARGEFLVIYDAEDRPEPDQLHKAVAAFRAQPEHVACLQARLNFYNAKENWLTRLFALDYALWFDFLLPGLERLRVPMPLGGTSNHFRVSALRAIHGWDPFNVTEDADIGIRLARMGYSVRTIDSTTYEEATNRLRDWFGQRARWMKGYMQTWLVHMRDPASLVRNAGWRGFLAFQLFIGGTFASALLNPLLWAVFVASQFTGAASSQISIAGLIFGNAVFSYLAMLGPVRRGWLELSPFGLLMPLYWLLISVAAYRALFELMRRPFHWQKTAHGLTRFAREIVP